MKERDKIKAEALLRMKKLGLPDEIISRFENSGIVYQGSSGGYYPVKSEQCRSVREFERRHGVSVYFIIRSVTGIGEIDSYLYVGENEERWAFERAEIEKGRAAAYFCVYKIPKYSAFCTVGFELTPMGIRCAGRADL